MFGMAKRSRLLAVVGVVVLGSIAFSGAQGFANPPGNNGTVKIDGIEFDVYPDNEPHVGCVFQVDFYGFDQGNLNASIKFFAQPPTGRKDILLESGTVFIGEDSNAGGGSVEGLDAQSTWDLSDSLQPFMAHPQQGYHVKLLVNAPGSIGSDRKSKTFWVAECAPPPPV